MLTIHSWSLEAQNYNPGICDTKLLVETYHHPDEYMEIGRKTALKGLYPKSTYHVYTNDLLMFTCLRVMIKRFKMKGVMWEYASVVHLDQYEAFGYRSVIFDSDGRLANWPETHFDFYGELLKELL